MNANVRPSGRIAVVLFLLFCIPAWPGAGFATNVGRGFPGLSAVEGSPANAGQSVPAPDLDLALRAGDLDRARQLVPVNWAASEQLIVSYLERALISPAVIPGQPDARTLAGRLADVFFKIVEYDFARAVVVALDTPDSARRQQLIGVVRDYFVTLERLRMASQPLDSALRGVDLTLAGFQRNTERQATAAQFFEIADRFRALSFPRGELWTLRSMINLTAPGQPSSQAMANKLADQLGDELSLVAKRPFTEASVAMAERLGLPWRQVAMLSEMGGSLARSTDPAKLDLAARYLERARILSRSVPPLESVNSWLSSSAAPTSSLRILPDLWSVYQGLKRPADASPLVTQALEISGPFGERAVLATISAFASQPTGFDGDTEATFRQAGQAFGPKVELAAMRALSGTQSSFRTEIAERALVLAVALPDSHERAVTLEWYSRSRELTQGGVSVPDTRLQAKVDVMRKDEPPFPAAYDQLLQLCLKSDEVGLTADALASHAEFHARTGNSTAAVATFDQAMQHAEGAGDFRKAAEVAIKAALSSGLPKAPKVDFARRAVEPATKADHPLVLAKALKIRALSTMQAGDQRLQDLQQAVAAAERYTAQSGDAREELTCLRAVASERAIRGEYQLAIDVLERAATRARTFQEREPEMLAYQEMTRVYSTCLGEPALALAAAERARQLVSSETTGPSGQPSPVLVGQENSTMAVLYQTLGQPVAALEAHTRALAAFASVKSAQNQRRTLSSRARLLTELGDYDAALRDWDEVLGLLKATEKAFVLEGSALAQKARWLGEVAGVHWLAGNREKALALARESIAELSRGTLDDWVRGGFVNDVVGILLEANASDEAMVYCSSVFQKVLALPMDQPWTEKDLLETIARIDLKSGESTTPDGGSCQPWRSAARTRQPWRAH